MPAEPKCVRCLVENTDKYTYRDAHLNAFYGSRDTKYLAGGYYQIEGTIFCPTHACEVYKQTPGYMILEGA